MADPRFINDVLRMIEYLYQKGLVVRLKSMKLREPTVDEIIALLKEDDEDPDPSGGPPMKIVSNPSE